MDWLINFLTVVGLVDAALLVIAVLYAIYLWASGITPALLRLGNGLAKRRIAIFAKSENLASLKHLLLDSKLFREKNICEVTQFGDVGRAEGSSVYLVYWPDWSEHIDAVLAQKPDECALVVYAPYNAGRIPDERMKDLDGKRHTAVTNFRGRLLNDIVTSMITTSYDSR